MQTDWNIISAIGCIIGGIAAAWAAFVAWWQYKKSNSKSIRLKVNTNLLFLSSILGGKYIGNQIQLKVMNVGNVGVTLKGWGLSSGKMNFAIIPTTQNQLNCANLPVTIKPNTCEILSVLTADLYKELRNCVDKGLLKENAKLLFYVYDSFDEEYKIKTPYTYRKIRDFATMRTQNN